MRSSLIPVRVARKTIEAVDICSFELVHPSGEPLPPFPFSCEQGVCGTCLTRVLDGEPDHRDHFLSEDERRRNDQFTTCCSRSHSPMLVIDL